MIDATKHRLNRLKVPGMSRESIEKIEEDERQEKEKHYISDELKDFSAAIYTDLVYDHK